VRILLYSPDNGVTRNFMPHLWMFLLQSLTPPGHEVLLIDGNAQPMDEGGIARYVREQKIELVGIGAMTRMIAKAYRMADAVRAVGVPVIMGGPHVTELADEALGRDGGPRHADAVALGEADETWPKIVEDAARGELKDVYAPVDEFGQERKPTLQPYPAIRWDSINLDQFNLVPKIATPLLRSVGGGWGTFRIIPVESGGRLTRPKHRQEFIPFEMAHTPLRMSISEAHAEVKDGWARSYSPEAIAQAVDSLDYKPLGHRLNILIARLCFRGIYFPMMGRFAWVKVISQNRRTFFKLVREAFGAWRGAPLKSPSNLRADGEAMAASTKQ